MRITCRLFFAYGIVLVMHAALSAQPLAPTLSAGLTTITGQRGDLDIALLTEIIGEKQEELKHEILERKIITSVDDQSFALKNFVYSSFYSLLTYKDENAIEKELLTQIAIFSLQAGLGEAILQLSYRKSNPSEALINSINAYIMDVYESPHPDSIAKLTPALKKRTFPLLFTIDDVIDKLAGARKQGRKDDKFAHVLLDAIYEAVRQNGELQKLGFVKLHPNLESKYAEYSKFLSADNSISTPLFSLVDPGLNLLVIYHPVFFDFINDFGVTIESIKEMTLNKRMDISKVAMMEKVKNVADYLTVVSDGMEQLLANNSISEEKIDELTIQLNEIREGFNDFMSRNEGGDLPFTVNDYRFIRDYIEPYANEMLSLGILTNEHLNNIGDLRRTAFSMLVNEVYNAINSNANLNALDTIQIQEFGNLIRIITSLSRLDDVKSYEHLFNSLAQVGVNSLENTEVKFLRDIVFYVEAYTTLDRDNNRMNVDVEGLLLKLFTLYENRAVGDAQLYLGTGVGQTLDVDYNGSQYLLLGRDSAVINNLSFASEKIGVKLKVINNKRIQAKHEEELTWFFPKLIRNNHSRFSTPIISDVYVFGYGSGLLYNIANLTSEGDNFDYAMVGVGVGIAFFNSLDVNIWRASPMVGGNGFSNSWKNRQFYGFSFDIKLTEYLTALGKKRRAMKLELEN